MIPHSQVDDAPVSLVIQPKASSPKEEVVQHFFLEVYPLDKTLNRLKKRLFDVFFSILVCLFVLSWLIPILAFFIKITSRGSVFFGQKRTGLHNQVFLCWKLRTMVPNKDTEHKQAVKNDARVTFAGRFLRKFSLDELPQFYNVLKGDMSLIGPRPHMLTHTERFSKEVAQYHLRHGVKPGITGLSQVMGYRGEIHHRQALQNRVRFDIFYMKKWSLGLDILIIFKTIKLLLFGDKNAY